MKIVFAEQIGISTKQKSDFVAEMQQESHIVQFFDAPIKDQADLRQRIADSGILVIGNYPLSESTISLCPNLKLISVAFTGVDHLPVDYCKLKDIAVCNAAGYSTTAVSELTICLAISLLRNVVALDLRTRSENSRDSFLGEELQGKTFGIIGLGAIGTKVAQLATAFGCKVIAHTRTPKIISNVELVSFNELMANADIVSLHIPANSQTVGLISRQAIGLMKPTATLINTARGTLIDYNALSAALKNNTIAGTAVDVYEHEPPIEKGHPLFGAPNTILLPHVGFATTAAIDQRTGIVLENIRCWLKGKPQNVMA